MRGAQKWELRAECRSPCVPSLAVMKCHAWRNRPNLGLQTQFPKTDGGELEVNKLREDVGTETGEEVVGCGKWTWLMQVSREQEGVG